MYFKKGTFFLSLLLMLLTMVVLPTQALAANWQQVARDVGGYLQQAAELYQQGDAAAAKDALDQGYFGPFEEAGMEAAVKLKLSPARSFELEYGFTELKQLVDQGVTPEAFYQAVDGLKEGVTQAAVEMSGSARTPWNIFVYSFLIIVREGFEAILIVAAIIAYLIKSGNKDKVKVIYQSVAAAILASIATAVAFQYLFSISGAGQEIMEGITMLLAMAVLFSVSFWLVSKAESEKWQAFIEGKVQDSITVGSSMALWFTAFLAVYREGAETVLFYQALLADIQGGISMAVLGFIVGSVVLVFIFMGVRLGSMRIPLKPFFIGTSVLLYYLAFVFAGKGVRELQEGGLIGDTLAQGFPRFDLMGIYPSWESLSLQGVLLAAILIGLIYQFYFAKQGGGSDKKTSA